MNGLVPTARRLSVPSVSLSLTLFAALCLPGQPAAAAPASDCDVLVFADTPCGIAAAVSAARLGHRVTLVGQGRHAGGMMSGGLSISDVRIPAAHGGLFREFAGRVLRWYTERYGADSQQVRDCNGGLWFEPHVAEQIFNAMLSEQATLVRLANRRLVRAIAQGDRLCGAVFEDRDAGRTETVHAAVVIDASYEGDLAAAAGTPCRVGREDREEHWEPYAGQVFLQNPGLQLLPGGTGQGDRLIQAYNYRLCMTDRDDLRVPIAKPDGYDRGEFTPLAELAGQGKIRSIHDVIRLAPIPNGKYNANNRPIVRSLDLPGANTEWPEGSDGRRAEIVARYRQYTLGLLWFLQHDEELPAALCEDALRWGLCADEFADTGHLPHQLYVREARRIVGRKTFSAHDAMLAPGRQRSPLHEDSVAVADYHVDSHLVQRQSPGWPQVEGHVYLRALSKPAQVPFGVMVPQRPKGLLVPGAMSATHLGFGVLRMEPVWMALGQAAGTAAHLAIDGKTPPGEVPIDRLQRQLLAQGAVLTFFFDVPGPDPIWQMMNVPAERARLELIPAGAPSQVTPGVQFFGARGYIDSYFARPLDPVTRGEAAEWLYRFLGRPAPPAGASRQAFADLGADHPYGTAVAALCAAGIVEAWDGSRGFFAGAALSRADAARWVTRAIRLRQTQPAPSESPWEDLPAGDPAFADLFGLHRISALPQAWGADRRIQARTAVAREEFLDMLYAATTSAAL